MKGGAITLAGMASLVFNSNSTFLFVNNHADFVGGAIYWYSVDQHDYFSSHTCFLKKTMIMRPQMCLLPLLTILPDLELVTLFCYNTTSL